MRDFAPYVAKIKAAGADTIITGNWGADLALLVKAARDAGSNANFYTYYAVVTAGPGMGAAGADRVRRGPGRVRPPPIRPPPPRSVRTGKWP